MTNKEAKREIDNIDYYLQHHTDDYSERSHDAMMMAISALERQTGEWIINPYDKSRHECSVCGQFALQTMTGCLMNRHLEDYLSDYCPSCGADMRKESHEV